MIIKAIDPDLMHMLVCIAEEQNLTAAGRRLLLTQQAVSAQVKRLESLTGRHLVHRTPRKVSLTEDGESLLVYAREIINLSDRLNKHLGASNTSTIVKLGFTPGFSANGLLALFSALRCLQPNIEIRFEVSRTDYLINKLERGEIDIVVGAQNNGGGMGELLFRDNLEWIGDLSLVKEIDRPVPLVLLLQPAVQRDIIFDALSAAKRTWVVHFESDDPQAQRAAVLARWGVSAHPGRILEGSGMSPMPPNRFLPKLNTFEIFLRCKSNSSNIVQCFAEIIRTKSMSMVENREIKYRDYFI